MKYPKPPSRRTKRLSHAIKTHNPDGLLNKVQGWSKCGKKPFIELKIEDGLWEETYLAALLSCWLCTFVLPSEDPNTIRPGTFKVASFLATGRPFCLAIPVLVSLYRGLNKIAHSSPMISRSGACFPVHYIYGWLGLYFKTHYEIDVPGSKMVVYSGEGGAKHFDEHEARKLIQGTSMQWDANLYVRNREETFLDDGGLSRNSLSYFISIRSSYLSMRQDGHLIVEPYSPFWFSHQFGLCQDIPGTIKEDIRQGTLDKIVEFWRLCTPYKTSCKAFFPVPPTLVNFKLHTTSGYKKWWNHIHGKYLDDGIDILIASAHPTPPKSKVVQPINVKSNNNKDIRLPKVHVANTISKSMNHHIQSKESQGVIAKLKKPPPKTPSVERSLEVHDAFERGANPILEEMSDDNDSDHHWNQTKKPKLTIPSNPNSLRDITSASANLEGAKDQVSFFFIIFFF